MAKQAAKGTVIPKNLSKINKGKKKDGKKFLAEKVKDSDPNSLETVFKKKKNRKAQFSTGQSGMSVLTIISEV